MTRRISTDAEWEMIGPPRCSVGSGRAQAVRQCDVLAIDAGGAETLCATAQGTIWKAG